MSAFKIPLPHITATSEKEQLSQIKNYLYQMSEQLEWALNNISTSTTVATVIKQPVQSQAASGGRANIIDPDATFNAIKSLIIKSADIVDAYYEEINKKLESVYVAESTFGTYTEQATQTLTENSNKIQQAFTNIQTIGTDIQGIFTDIREVENNLYDEVEGIRQNAENTTEALSGKVEALAKSVDAILTVNAHIKSGLLFYNSEGLPIYGVEVGQTNNVNGTDVFRKFARFTADRLSFYDQNNTEVAYISDYMLYITSVEILYNLTGGGFMLDFSRGFTLKYKGGD